MSNALFLRSVGSVMYGPPVFGFTVVDVDVEDKLGIDLAADVEPGIGIKPILSSSPDAESNASFGQP